jgi:hypothetical protein
MRPRDGKFFPEIFSKAEALCAIKRTPKNPMPPSWAELDESPLRAEEGILREVNLIEPMKLLLSNEWTGKSTLPKSTALMPLSRPDCTRKSSPSWGDP